MEWTHSSSDVNILICNAKPTLRHGATLISPLHQLVDLYYEQRETECCWSSQNDNGIRLFWPEGCNLHPPRPIPPATKSTFTPNASAGYLLRLLFSVPKLPSWRRKPCVRVWSTPLLRRFCWWTFTPVQINIWAGGFKKGRRLSPVATRFWGEEDTKEEWIRMGRRLRALAAWYAGSWSWAGGRQNRASCEGSVHQVFASGLKVKTSRSTFAFCHAASFNLLYIKYIIPQFQQSNRHSDAHSSRLHGRCRMPVWVGGRHWVGGNVSDWALWISWNSSI